MKYQNILIPLSGGIDSVTVLYKMVENWGQPDSIVEIKPVFFDYGQRHAAEVKAAEFFSSELGLELAYIDQLKYKDFIAAHRSKNSSKTMLNRNMFFLIALHSYAVLKGFDAIALGVNLTDTETHPDCDPALLKQFIAILNNSAGLHELDSVKLLLPLCNLTKADIFRELESIDKLDSVLKHARSCYRGEFDVWRGKAVGYGCGQCNACITRQAAYDLFVGGRGDS